MKIDKIRLRNFRIYKGDNEIKFFPKNDKNINIIAGKNGYGKTTFLTSLIWGFYGKMMGEVEDKYKNEIKTAGGYDKFLKSLYNRDYRLQHKNKEIDNPFFSVEIVLTDILIPSIPCKSVTIRRTFDVESEKESLTLLIDGLENELTKEIGRAHV